MMPEIESIFYTQRKRIEERDLLLSRHSDYSPFLSFLRDMIETGKIHGYLVAEANTKACLLAHPINTDPQSITEAIRIVINNKGLKSEFGKNAREFVVNNYSLEKVLELEINAIKSITDQL